MKNQVIKLLVMVSISTFSLASVAANEQQLTQIKATKDDCMISKNCLYKVSAPLAGQSFYLINEICEDAGMSFLYRLPLRDQISKNSYLGTKYCHGVVSYSDMNLPFSTHSSSENHGIQDANDGRLLVDYMESIIKEDLEVVDMASKVAQEAASGAASSDYQTEFSAAVSELGRIVESSHYNDLSPFDHSSFIDVPVNKGSNKVRIPFFNFSPRHYGLQDERVDTVEAAKVAFLSITLAKQEIMNASEQLKQVKNQLKIAADHDATITSIDLSANDIVVRKETN